MKLPWISLVFLLLGAPVLDGCGRGVKSVRVSEVHEVSDVPPPPDHRTLQLTGVPPGTFPLGEAVDVRDAAGTLVARGEIVVDEASPPSVTVYVPAEQAEAVLQHPGPLHATR